jgi:hypothetical protein
MRFNDRAMALAGIPDLPVDAFKKEGGKIKLHGGGGGPQTSVTQTSNIPEYAQPYVERMMGASEKQVYRYDPKGNITGFQPFQSYSQYARARGGSGETVAGFTPMQARAMQGIGQYQLPGQTAAASDITGTATLGSIQAGRGYMPGMFGTGDVGTGSFIYPGMAQAYMSPYQQAATDVEKRELARQSAIEGQRQQAQAVQAGAFGGSRQGLVEAERQRNLMQQMGDIQARGGQSAFQQAQQQFNAEQQAGLQAQLANQQMRMQAQQAREQSRQFSAELGMKGYGQALQGAGQLGALGEQQYKQELGLLGQQYDVGAKQQAYEQSRLNQIIQDYATSQQYPFIQLGTLSNMLRGLPMQAATTQMYQAQPSFLQQGIGLAGAYANLKQAGAFGAKEGGEIKEMASGGIATGDPYKLPSMMKKLSDEQLSEKMGGDVDPETMGIAQAEKQRRDHIRKGMAGGGAVAFKEGGTKIDQIKNPMLDDSEEPKKEAPAVATRPKTVVPKPAPVEKSPYQAALTKAMAEPSPIAPEITKLRAQEFEASKEAGLGIEGQMARKQEAYKKYGIDPAAIYAQEKSEQKKFLDQAEGDAKKAESLRWAQMWAKFGSTPGPILKAALISINDTIPDLLDDQKYATALQRSIKKTIYDLDRAEYLEKKGMVDDADKLDREAKANVAQISLAAGKLIAAEYENRIKPVTAMAERELAGETEIAKTRIQEGMRAKAEAARDARAEKKAEALAERQKASDTGKAVSYVQKELKKEMDELAEAQKMLTLPDLPDKTKKMFQDTIDRVKQRRTQVIKEAKALYENADVDKLLQGESAPAPATSAEFNYVPGKGLVPVK